jgi:hypothetical protein
MSQVSSVLTTFIAGLTATLLTDEQKLLQQPIDGYLNGVIADPSIINQQAQGVAFLGAVAGIAPQAGSTGIKDTAVALKTFIDVQLPNLVTAVNAELAAAANTGGASTAATSTNTTSTPT